MSEGSVAHYQRVDQDYLEPFPLDIYPAEVQRFIRSVAESVGCPVDFPAVVALVGCACSIGNAREIEIKPGWCERANLYAAIQGEKSSGTSPAYRNILYRQGTGPRHSPCAVTTDATVEGLILALRENNSHGVLYASDPLSLFAKGLNKYRKGQGNDPELIQSLWDTFAVEVMRTKAWNGERQLDAFSVGRPFLSILAIALPDEVAQLAGAAPSLFDRFLLSSPDAVKRSYETNGIDPAAHDDYWKVLDGLFALHESVGEGETTTMSPEGAREWASYASWHMAEVDHQPDYMRSAWLKLLRYTAKFVLILHVVYRVSGTTGSITVEPETIRQAVHLTRYFASHAGKVRRQIRGENRDARIMQLIPWLRRHDGEATVRQILAGRLRGLKEVADVMATFERLQAMKLGTIIPGTGRGLSSVKFILSGTPSADSAERIADRKKGV
jgi:Protein of unknown function (DUF3987)